MADLRYLKRRRQGWYFVLTVPKDLRGKFLSARGKPLSLIVVSLGTRDLSEAQHKRWALRTQYGEAFKRAAVGAPLTLTEIEAQAQEVYTTTLERMEADAKRGIRAWAGTEQDGDDPETAGLHIEIDQYVEALEAKDFIVSIGIDLETLEDQTKVNVIADEMAAVQRRTGVTIEPGTETYRLLGKAIINGKIAALNGRIKALQGEASEPPETFLGAVGIDPVALSPIRRKQLRPKIRLSTSGANGLAFSEAAQQFISELQRDHAAALTEQTRGQYEAVFRLFGQYAKNAPLTAIDRATAADFLSAIATLHPHWGRAPKAKEMEIEELLKKFGGGEQQLSNKTLNRYASALSALFKWARKRGKFDGINPFTEQSRPKASRGTTEWLPYKIEELNTLFKAPPFNAAAEQRLRPAEHTTETAMRWVPLIALYSGMRLGEICQLRTGDVKREHKVRFFNVAEEGEGQRVKTGSAIRRVPVHSMLIRCGLLDYLDALPAGQLFPGLKPGGPDDKLSWYFTRRYTEFRRGVGVTRPRLSFHSFRKNVVTALDRARVPQADIAGLIGHERGFTLDVYAPLGLDLTALQRITEKIKYTGVSLAHLYKSS